MPDLPAWTLADVRPFLAGYGLEGDVRAAAPLEGGCDNLNLLFTLGDRRLVLRRYSHTPAEQIEWELQLIRLLHARGFPTPAVFPRVDGALSADFLGRPAALFEFVPGREADPQSPREAAQVAGAIAELHLLTRDLHLPHARPHTDWARLDRLEATAARLSSPGLGEMAARVRQFRLQFAARLASVRGPLPAGIVHHDTNPGNALIGEEGRLVALLDFDEAHEGEFLSDVAALLRLWATPRSWQGLRPEMVEAVLSTYHARRPLSRAEWELLPDFLLFFTLADAAEYVSRALASDPARAPVRECRTWQRFLDLERDRKWAELLAARAE